MPRLLLVTPSELTRDPRARRAAVAALRRGWDVTGLCGQTSGELAAPLEGVRIARVGQRAYVNALVESGLAARRPEQLLLRELRGIYRLVRLAVRTTALWRAGVRLGHFDVVHANDFDALLAGALLALRSRARLVYDAHELYSAFEADPPRLYRAVALWLEALLARRADAVVTVSEPLANELRQRLRLARPPLVVLNAPPVDGGEPPQRPSGRALRAVYVGSFGPGRTVSDLLDAIERAPSVHLTLRAVRAPAEALAREASARGLKDRLAIADALPPDEVVGALKDADVGLIFDRPVTRNTELALPNKLFEYLAAGLAVVASRLPALTCFIEGEHVGLTFEPGRPEDLARALERLACDRALLAELRARARRVAVDRYNADEQTRTLEKAWAAA